jgi:hypothetical protein
LYQKLLSAELGDDVIEDELSTDARVFARITDGIYREPASAIRELISNAYDADATEVNITTDYPRFSNILIKDNGNGLSRASVARLVKHIGGSSKRTLLGKDLGTVNSDNPTLSPGGRKLIGKIGIGLFAVSQLTSTFKIITKQKGDKHFVVINVHLSQYSEDDLAEENQIEYKSGTVQISLEKANCIDDHGTEIILSNLKPASIRELSSYNLWERISLEKENRNDGVKPYSPYPDFEEEITAAPIYHIGKIDPKNKELIENSAQLPWSKKDKPEEKFKRLVEAVIDEQTKSVESPTITKILDNYLQTIWNLSLSAPLDYLDFDPWNEPKKDGFLYYNLSNSTKGQSKEISGPLSLNRNNENKRIEYANSPFSVYVDGVKLFRPMRFENLPKNEKNSIKESLLFFGNFEQDLTKLGKEYSGGNKLSFDAFAFWNSAISPKEHRGVIIRVNDASGNTFDSTFLGYQVSEQTRLRQITFEINVREGLDAAINIDRESFNYAHPHFQIIKRWVHSAVRQIVNRLKALAKSKRDEKNLNAFEAQIDSIESVGNEEWFKSSSDRAFSSPPDVELIKMSEVPDLFQQQDIRDSRRSGKLVIDRNKVIPASIKHQDTILVKVEALTKILHGFDVFEDMDYNRQQELIRAITRIFTMNE